MVALPARADTLFATAPTRIVGAIGQPVLFWILFARGWVRRFKWRAGTDVSYREYFFPGTLALILLFTAIFSTISIIEDRREGFLQSVLVAPISRWTMVLGKVLGGTVLAVGQGMLFLLLGLTVGLHFSIAGTIAAALFSLLVAFALTSLGFVIAWHGFDSGLSRDYERVSVADVVAVREFFPADSGWLRWIMIVNPLTYGIAGLRRLLYLGETTPTVSRNERLAVIAGVAWCDCSVCRGYVRPGLLDRGPTNNGGFAVTMQLKLWLSLLLVSLGAYGSYAGWREVYQATASDRGSTVSRDRHIERTRSTGSLDDAALVDTSGKPFSLNALKGDVWLASFFFTACPARAQ